MIVFSWNTEFRQVGWTVGPCPSCRRCEAIRIEDAMRVFRVYFLRASEDKIGIAFRCDFCERPIQMAGTTRGIKVSEWTPSDGFAALAGRVSPLKAIEYSSGTDRDRLQSLLGSVLRERKLFDVVSLVQ